ncbi:unnamed protein product, partial [Prorocentrum cordatum]
ELYRSELWEQDVSELRSHIRTSSEELDNYEGAFALELDGNVSQGLPEEFERSEGGREAGVRRNRKQALLQGLRGRKSFRPGQAVTAGGGRPRCARGSLRGQEAQDGCA